MIATRFGELRAVDGIYIDRVSVQATARERQQWVALTAQKWGNPTEWGRLRFLSR